MIQLRFHSPYEDAWTYCSFAGGRESDAVSILGAVLLSQDFELEITDDESEDWKALGELPE